MYRRPRARHLAVGSGAAALGVTFAATTANAGPARPLTAAERYDWGAPLPEWPDEFGYGSEAGPAARAKWRLAGGPTSTATTCGAPSTKSTGPGSTTCRTTKA